MGPRGLSHVPRGRSGVHGTLRTRRQIQLPQTLPAGGTYEGPFEAMEYFTTIEELFEDASPAPEEFLRVDPA